MFPSASNLIPLDMPLGERKMTVLPLLGSYFQMCPASITPFLSLATCEKVMSLKYTMPSGATATPSVSTTPPSKIFSGLAPGGTISDLPCDGAPGVENRNATTPSNQTSLGQYIGATPSRC